MPLPASIKLTINLFLILPTNLQSKQFVELIIIRLGLHCRQVESDPSPQIDPRIDPQKSATEGRAVSASVMVNGNETKLLTLGDQKFSLSETSSVSNSPQVAVNARCRVRTCDFLRVKQALYH